MNKSSTISSQKSAKSRSYRKTTIPKEEEEEAKVELSSVLELTKDIQKSRLRGKGLEIKTNGSDKKSKDESDKFGLEAQFTKQEIQVVEHSQVMNYIESKLKQNTATVQNETPKTVPSGNISALGNFLFKKADSIEPLSHVDGMVENLLKEEFKIIPDIQNFIGEKKRSLEETSPETPSKKKIKLDQSNKEKAIDDEK